MKSIIQGTPSDHSVIHLHTNRHTRPLVPVVIKNSEWAEVTNELDLDESSEGFWYLGSLYCLDDYTVAGSDVKALGFDGVQPDSYFSATVVRFFDRDGYELDGEIIVGRIHW